jgi:hypothetical protein
MFCPKCGQIQAASEQKFCSRCGFLLAGVVQLLESGGLQLPSESTSQPSGLSQRTKGIRQGAMMMLLTLLLVPLMAILTVNLNIIPQLLIPLTAIVCFVGGLLRIIYALMFEEAGARAAVPVSSIPAYMAAYTPPQVLHGGQRQEIGASKSGTSQGIPVSTWQKPRNTAELVTPPSVTENPTQLLDERSNDH